MKAADVADFYALNEQRHRGQVAAWLLLARLAEQAEAVGLVTDHELALTKVECMYGLPA